MLSLIKNKNTFKTAIQTSGLTVYACMPRGTTCSTGQTSTLNVSEIAYNATINSCCQTDKCNGANSDGDSGKKGLSDGALAGIVVGVIASATILGVITFCIVNNLRKNSKKDKNEIVYDGY